MNIILIDDHTLFNESLNNILQNEYNGSLIKMYSSAESFLMEDQSTLKPDVIISDIMMKGISGIDLISEARKRFGEDVQIIIVSSVTDIYTIKNAFSKGANAYISKDASKHELLEAIDMRNRMPEKYTNKSIKDKLLKHLFSDDTELNINLSPREKEVLAKICEGITPKEISFEMNISIHTVRRFIKNIMNKFQIHRTAELITFAIQKGLYKPED